MENFDKENKYIRAKERVEDLKKFYGNLTSYLIIIPSLAILNYVTNGWSYAWFLWAAFGWGIGLLAHAMGVYGYSLVTGKNWEERKIREFMKQEESKKY